VCCRRKEEFALKSQELLLVKTKNITSAKFNQDENSAH